ncbi:Glycosyltransferase involved in cell wall bisynthesis [Rhizobium sp. RU20A]|uniref:glycosyltransferase n=1 Tax=Rhizobium sp. RU20A TaxID=1907412 RepID=UPI000956D2A7|nr:glycosyltransferase [Rhizobium sp. RU20A]SIR11747.1 Glycosyltransferase involved in cell wall bisynthesis [Rhizobium sp. RU20A]
MPTIVVFMINSLAGGGAERIMARLVANSTEWAGRYEIHLVLLDEEKAAYDLPEWVTVHRLDTGFSLTRGVWRAVALMWRLRPAVCLSFLSRSNFINVIAARLLGYKAVISERVNASSHHSKTLSGKLARFLTRFLYPHADRIVCPSAGIAVDLVENFAVADGKNVVIPNPIDTDRIWQLSKEAVTAPTERPYIVAVGRLVENKNFGMLLNAFAMADTYLDLVILGEGPLRQELQTQVGELGLQGRVHFPGFASNPFPIISNAFAYALPSNAEGFPNGLAEAINLGVPAISTNCLSGPSEILDDKGSIAVSSVYKALYGVLVPVDDAFAMAEGIKLMTDETIRRHYAAQALQGATRYRLTPAINAYWQVIENELVI